MMKLGFDGHTVMAQTNRYTAELQGARLTKLIMADGRVLVDNPDAARAGLELVPMIGQGQPIGVAPIETVRIIRLGDLWVQMFISGWHADAVIEIRLDEQTGELLVTPSLATRRPGVAGVRWNIDGIARDLELVAPVYQGVRLRLDDPLAAGNAWPGPVWDYPLPWEAPLAILQGSNAGAGGFSVCCHDTRWQYKHLRINGTDGRYGLSFGVSNYGTGYDSRAAGGLTWRLNVHSGDWQEPARAYRDWLRRAWNLDEARRHLAPWRDEVKLAVSWCPNDLGLLDALAEQIEPKKVYLHVPNWREDAYDCNYPRSVAGAQGRHFLAKANAMGFRAAPHFNHWGLDPAHPAMDVVEPFLQRWTDGTSASWGTGAFQDDPNDPDPFWKYISFGGPFAGREPTVEELKEWTKELGPFSTVPQAGGIMKNRPHYLRLTGVHTGLAWWRAYFMEQVKQAVDDVGFGGIFADQMLVVPNGPLALVENMTAMEGTMEMGRRLVEMPTPQGPLVLGTEGRNEMTMQYASFGQVHMFKSHFNTVPELERVVCPVNEVLFEGMGRSFGYAMLRGNSELSAMRMRAEQKLGVIPTIMVHSPEEIRRPNPAIAGQLRRAAEE